MARYLKISISVMWSTFCFLKYDSIHFKYIGRISIHSNWRSPMGPESLKWELLSLLKVPPRLQCLQLLPWVNVVNNHSNWLNQDTWFPTCFISELLSWAKLTFVCDIGSWGLFHKFVFSISFGSVINGMMLTANVHINWNESIFCNQIKREHF